MRDTIGFVRRAGMSMVKILVIAVCIVAVVVAAIGVKHLMTKKEFTAEEYEKDYEVKKEALEKVLGPMDDTVGHAIVPYAIGGLVDMYYFSKGIPGTGMATMELIEPDGSGTAPNRIGTYELVAFTNNSKTEGYKPGDKSAFDNIERRMCWIFTTIGRYGMDEIINPGETAEIPMDDNEVCWLIFDEYRGPSGQDFVINGKRHCLLLCMEIFKSEGQWAMKNNRGKKLITKLKNAGYYPYSDLNRKPVE
jgi:hypothetical protein